jgi:hypothetical protein
MTAKNKTIITISFSALAGFLLGAVIVFIGVSNYLGKHTADIAARKAANQLTRDVQVLQNLETGHQDKAIELVKFNIKQKYVYLNSLRHDASEITRAEVNSAIAYARGYLGDTLTATKEAN